MTKDRFAEYKNTYAFKHLGHSLSEEGVWLVKGEDSNCDLGGPHHNPTLGYFEGKLEDVIRYAVELPDFWQWGGGGSFVKQGPPKVVKIGPDALQKRKDLLAKKDALAKELADIEAQIGGAK